LPTRLRPTFHGWRIDRPRALLRHRAEPGSDVGLLDGAAGVALALHTTASHTPPVSGWDACLLTHG